ncbi:MAG: energy transducer TonB [Pseudomonadota bacterium]|jgi:protein TonB|uniref:Protein TonB n=1 Tax=Alteromonas oceani TaxID=2071609 RepID=A0ABV7JUZ7_9ALTE|nr:energy transducer TonB [Alteromonas oceani]MAD09664.1 protein TonB [Alteromonas sp.]MBR9794027.1 energy transducer TonB [Gammaproteobacteria bacterium]MDG6098005.1 energy transducer TonB [Alteromonas sp. ZYF713]MEC8227673.1 energy transducer TonB [Pseudomonadota bacterium]MEC9261155.1 energy transducer TonB [Pseudomonadota bacterium]|tara:strand:+ start:9176 stop:9787 length:612 start_codon:yes stop_codon:yes gene_type:complete
MSRFLIAFVVSLAITLGLFFLMQSLIKMGGSALTEPPKGSVLDFVRIKPEEQVQKKERKPRKPPKPEEPPPPMDSPQMDSPSPDADSSGMSFAADVGDSMALEGGGLALEGGDGEYLPIVKVSPVYPRRALQRGIEGFVIVEFTVTKQGAVKDVFVIEANPEGIFEQAAMDAAKKFKYKPRVVNGEPAEVSGVQNRITFQIDG